MAIMLKGNEMNEETKEILKGEMKFRQELILKLQARNAIDRLVHGISTSSSGDVCVTTTIESTTKKASSQEKLQRKRAHNTTAQRNRQN